MNKLQTIINNIKFEQGLYKNNPIITRELNKFLSNVNNFIVKPPVDTLNDFLNSNIRVYDILMADCNNAKEKRAYNFMINFILSNR